MDNKALDYAIGIFNRPYGDETKTTNSNVYTIIEKEYEYMYKSVIDIRREVSSDVLKLLVAKADKAFNNRAGRVRNVSTIPYRLSYEGGENQFGCLQLGMLALEKEKNFLHYVSAWNWIDEEEPEENEDILAEMEKPVR